MPNVPAMPVVLGLVAALVGGPYGPAMPALGQNAPAMPVQSRIGDVTKLKGQSTNVLIGAGLVTGLDGTGDGGQYAPAMRALAEMMQRLAAPVVSMDELRDADNVAIVSLEVVVPETGAREGDRLDVHVTSMGAAKSLKGGRLLVTPLIYHEPHVRGVFATCRGPLRMVNPESETAAVIDDGATLEQDVMLSFLASGSDLLTQFGHPRARDHSVDDRSGVSTRGGWIEPAERYVTLVIDDRHAGWALASEIADTIDTELSLAADRDRVAVAVDPRNVVVLVPESQSPAQWISEIESLALLMPEGAARVTIDRKSGTIVVSGNATISPVIVSQKGLTISVLNDQSVDDREPPPDPLNPVLEPPNLLGGDPRMNSGAQGLGSGGGGGPSGGEARVSNLLVALNRLQVPIEDRIAVLSEINRMGRLHAELLFNE